MRWVALGIGLGLAAPAWADPVWQRDAKLGASADLSLVVNLGPHPDRRRFGMALGGDLQWYWYEGKHGWDGPIPLAPLARIAGRWGWTAPFVFAELTAEAGMLYPATVFERGYIPAVGLIAGGGVGIATDGWVGPLVVGTVLGPLCELRLEAAFDPPTDALGTGRWQGRLLGGPSIPVLASSYDGGGGEPPPLGPSTITITDTGSFSGSSEPAR